ncbi:Alpha-L-fucosidase [Mycena sanguinolenta]|uniref:Alpha-L-fucosidase n=1 Tax=Mycena sanguinolenta TaxID=230812 RepID=A0A8H6YLS4_9AGAR|nr:Alpha-L-fucosidase [Mycena sanguinolenta]
MSVIVDDNDPLVQYSPPGGWTKGGKGPEFDTTTHASATSGDTATLAFEGTSIRVYGTLDPSLGSRLNFSIDGVYNESYQAPEVPATVFNQLFWTSPLFDQAQHTLVVTVDQDLSLGPPANFENQTFFLDYFIYTTMFTDGQTLLIDDTDSSVTYSSDSWQSSNSTDSCLESTQHVSTSVGSWATASFSGTGISLFGPRGQKGFSASIVVDGSQPVISRSQTGPGKNQLFNTSGLSSGPHIINVTVLEGNLGIDYFSVTDAGSPAPATPQSAAPQSATPQSASAPTESAQSAFSKTPLPIAAIVGGVIGGLIILVSLLAVIIWKRRRRARRNNGVSVLPRWMRRDNNDSSVTIPRPFQPSNTMEPPPGVSVLPQKVESDADVAPQPFQASDTKEPQPSVSVSRRRVGSDVDNLSIVVPSFQASERSATTELPPPYTSND